MSCRQYAGAYLHPKCLTKHKISDANKENVTCKEPYDMFFADDDEELRETVLIEEPSNGLGPLVAMVRRLMDTNERMVNMNERMNEKMKGINEKMKEMKKMMNKMTHKDEVKGMINKVRQELVKEAEGGEEGEEAARR